MHRTNHNKHTSDNNHNNATERATTQVVVCRAQSAETNKPDRGEGRESEGSRTDWSGGCMALLGKQEEDEETEERGHKSAAVYSPKSTAAQSSSELSMSEKNDKEEEEYPSEEQRPATPAEGVQPNGAVTAQQAILFQQPYVARKHTLPPPRQEAVRVWKRQRCEPHLNMQGEADVLDGTCLAGSDAMMMTTMTSCTPVPVSNNSGAGGFASGGGMLHLHLNTLPTELLFEIFSWLSATDLWTSARATCTAWRALAVDNQLWRSVCCRTFRISWTYEQVRCCEYEWRELYKQLVHHRADLDISLFTGDERDRGTDPSPLGCSHYRRNIKMFAECCQRFFVCRHCHNETQDHEMNRYHVKTMYCMRCRTIQPMRGVCHSTICKGAPLANYFCGQCNFHDDAPGKNIYHCPHCNVCYRGKGLGIDYYHCQDCDLCFLLDFRATHQPIFRKKND
eukprot:TRINITY_DN3413_c0_g1_i1.p1 TRINITY_DN3413_c0_g1~~TRINITY_DN3413_c0_g1_i1.p1  ORF type:complete len:451 (-),score=54.42 TRINITY_DN3413_c0_g1_i1:5-1357(-)